MNKKEKKRLLKDNCQALAKLDEKKFAKIFPKEITEDEIFSVLDSPPQMLKLYQKIGGVINQTQKPAVQSLQARLPDMIAYHLASSLDTDDALIEALLSDLTINDHLINGCVSQTFLKAIHLLLNLSFCGNPEQRSWGPSLNEILSVLDLSDLLAVVELTIYIGLESRVGAQSLFSRLVHEREPENWMKEKLTLFTAEDFKTICCRKNEKSISVIHALLLEPRWHDFLLSEAMDAVLSFVLTEKGRTMLFENDAYGLKKLPKEKITAQFLIELFLSLDSQKNKKLLLHDVLKACPELLCMKAKAGPYKNQSLLALLLATQNIMDILLADDAALLSLIDEVACETLFQKLQAVEIEKGLLHGMKNTLSFKRAQDFLVKACRIEWLQHDNFQEQVASIFMSLNQTNDLSPRDFRLFVQHMGALALNTSSSDGASALYFLCRYREGVELIKERQLFKKVNETTLDTPIKQNGRMAMTLRTKLKESCGLQLQLDKQIADTLFFKA
jgi:hypothetical protein